ncbi:MAG: hypothetical protein KAI27_04920, partial [Rhodospirillaceae bacterium]|nr:hypothetical protein [Rhodospirillaceae bacterium]
GMGAVMGSKNLKAVAVSGNKRPPVHDKDGVTAIAQWLRDNYKKTHAAMQKLGTAKAVAQLNAGGGLPTRNFKGGGFEGYETISGEHMEETILVDRESCFACPVRCKRVVEYSGDGFHISRDYGGPEYETIASFGSNCGVSDLQVIAKANVMCNAYMLDSISTGATIAFAMECYEHGLIGKADTDGLDLRFGNAEAMLTMVERIAKRQGLGDLLAEGSLRAAQKIGGDALFFAMQVKGQELPMHDPRGKYNVGIGYAISEIGADHLVVAHDTMLTNPDSVPFKNARPLGIALAQPARSMSEEKMKQFYILEKLICLEKVIGYCFFGPAPRSYIQIDEMLLSINAATGWNLSVEDALLIGERATNMARIFNAREGFSRKDDVLPERLFQGLENGALQGEAMPREEFEQALTILYSLKGWDPETGNPTREGLDALSLGWAADMLT